MFSAKQQEYLNHADKRWNFKTGATRTGKTYLDYFIIPKRIRSVAEKDGLVVILGNTKGTLQRNIIEPLKKIYTTSLVSDIKSDNTAMLFGEKVYCLGADKVSQVDKIRGTSIKYCYGDEAATWHESVFNMLKSRLDKPYSKFDGTCNPEYPTHWLKQFLDSDADIYHQHYALDDNPFLDLKVKEAIKREYQGTVFYDRYVLGLWVPAEGAIYSIFTENKERYFTDTPDYDFIQLGIDFGGNGSAHSFTAAGITQDFSTLTVLMAEKHEAKGTSPETLYALFGTFVKRVTEKYGKTKPITAVYADSAEQVLINGLKTKFPHMSIRNSIKNEVIDRIRGTTSLMAGGRLFLTHDCTPLVEAFMGAVYDDKKAKDTRLDDGTSDIDSLDSFEYSWERYLHQYVRYEKKEAVPPPPAFPFRTEKGGINLGEGEKPDVF